MPGRCVGEGGDDRASSLFERCAAVCRARGRSVAEAPSLPLVFAGRPLGVLRPFGAIGPRPWIRRWIVGLPRCRGSFPERDQRALALLSWVPVSERFFGARLPVHAWRGSEFDRAAFSVLFGRSRFKPAKVATKRAGRMGSQRGAHGAGLGRSRRECKRHFALFKAVLRPDRAVACESAALGCLPSRWEEITGSASRSRRRAIVERAQSVARRMPCGRFAQRHAFFLSSFFFQTCAHGTDVDVGWRPWVLSLPGAMLNSMGGRGANRQRCASLSPAARRAACAWFSLPPSSPPKSMAACGGLKRQRPEPIMAPHRPCSLLPSP